MLEYIFNLRGPSFLYVAGEAAPRSLATSDFSQSNRHNSEESKDHTVAQRVILQLSVNVQRTAKFSTFELDNDVGQSSQFSGSRNLILRLNAVNLILSLETKLRAGR